MAYPTKNTNVVGLGLSRLISRYQGLPNITALLTSYLTEVQAAEDAAWDVFTLANISSAVGNALDLIGKIVGQAREGLSDTQYRVAIGLRILANRSNGRVPDLLKIASTLASQFSADNNGIVDYEEAPPLKFTVGLWNQTSPNVAASLLSEARAKSSGGVMIFTTWPDGADFSWSSTHDTAAGELGWGSVYSASTGGLLCSGRKL